MQPRVLGLVGPTAAGKSALALRAAQALQGEIVCMDSMQGYRGRDIGTAKPSRAEQALVPHHLLDVVGPGQAFSVAEYRGLAQAAIAGILKRGRLPILCGGTGLYLHALSQHPQLGGTPGDPAIRARWQALAGQSGNQAVHEALRRRDPARAAQLHPNNLRRVIRALEVLELTGQPMSAQRLSDPGEGPYDLRLYALRWPREQLYQRVDDRVARMLQEGLVEEVRGLVAAGLSPQARRMQGLGYKELLPFLSGQASLADCQQLLARRTRNYAKRQLTWFQADPRVRWLEAQEGLDANLARIIKEYEADETKD